MSFGSGIEGHGSLRLRLGTGPSNLSVQYGLTYCEFCGVALVDSQAAELPPLPDSNEASARVQKQTEKSDRYEEASSSRAEKACPAFRAGPSVLEGVPD